MCIVYVTVVGVLTEVFVLIVKHLLRGGKFDGKGACPSCSLRDEVGVDAPSTQNSQDV